MSWLQLDVLLAMAIYGFIVALILLGIWKAKKKSDSFKLQEKEYSSNYISVLIPFRNEAENLPNLILAIQSLKTFPFELIFINDHSDDASNAILEETQWPFPVQKVNLNADENGKKAAIRKGVELANAKFVLTWDADIIPLPTYFDELEKYPWASLNILPVEMRDSKWISGFFAWDYQLQSRGSLSIAGLKRPITCSGANLLFEKEAFLAVESKRTDDNLLSGDDQFLLAAFRNSGKSIQNLLLSEVTVTTNSPQTFKEGISQRSRWIGKSKSVQDNLANLFGLFVLIVQLSYYAFAFYQLSIGNYGATIVMVLIKGELDAFICTYKFQEQFNTLQVFLYELLFPIYILILLFQSFFITSKWKGRFIKKPF